MFIDLQPFFNYADVVWWMRSKQAKSGPSWQAVNDKRLRANVVKKIFSK